MITTEYLHMASVRFHHLVLAFIVGALCIHISNFGITKNALLASLVAVVAAAVNGILLRRTAPPTAGGK